MAAVRSPSWPSGTRRRPIRCSGSGRTARRWRPATPAPRCACWRCAGRSRRSSAARARAPGAARLGARRRRRCCGRWELDGIPIEPVPFVAPPRPWSYGSWGWWMAPTLARALARLQARWPFDVIHAHSILPPGHAVRLTRRAARARVVSTHGPDIIHVAQASRAGAPGDRGDAARRRPRDRQLRLGRASLPRAGGRADPHRGRAPGRRPAGSSPTGGSSGRRS